METVEIVSYDPQWPEIFSSERDALLARVRQRFAALEHIGSTAVSGQRAKPVIDMMAAIRHLEEVEQLLPTLAAAGYGLIDVGMRNRYFLRRQAPNGQLFHLHIVELATWDQRKERLMRDYLRAHPDAVQAYGALKAQLARHYSEDSLAYTKAKTAFIQEIVDKARDERGCRASTCGQTRP